MNSKNYYTSLFEKKNGFRGSFLRLNNKFLKPFFEMKNGFSESFAQTEAKKFFQKLFSHNTPAPHC